MVGPPARQDDAGQGDRILAPRPDLRRERGSFAMLLWHRRDQRVRSWFAAAPPQGKVWGGCIIFIDEIDAWRRAWRDGRNDAAE